MLQFLQLIYEVYIFIFKPVLFGVRIMLVKGNQVLLVRHTYKRGWYLPGGGLKRGETVEQSARREAREETGADIKQIELVGVFTTFEEKSTGHNILFLSDDFELIGLPDREIAEARFFALNALPGDLMPGHRRRLDEYRTGQRIPRFGEW